MIINNNINNLTMTITITISISIIFIKSDWAWLKLKRKYWSNYKNNNELKPNLTSPKVEPFKVSNKANEIITQTEVY